MKRRKFLAATAVTSLSAPLASAHSLGSQPLEGNEIYELRTYEIAWRGNQGALRSYLTEVEAPFLKSHGSSDLKIFSESGKTEPAHLWVLITFPDFTSYQNAIINRSENNFLQASASYTEAGKTFTRISSSLLYAIDSLKKMKPAIENASLFELRIYEGVNEDAVRRKIKMFNDEELELFLKVDMNPIFFGNMLVGPFMPSLVYMLNYRDMEHRDQVWKDFLAHPDWVAMRDKPEYAGTVSNIRRIFMELVH